MRKKLLVTAVIVVVALGAGVAGAQVQQRFNDVPTDHYAYEAANWAVEIGVTQGCGDGTNFCPERNLNRANMVTFLKRYHDWLTGPPTVSPAPPRYATYEAAVTAANDWYEQMEATIGGGSNLSDWQDVIPLVAEKADSWAGNDLIADRIANEALVMSRTGDPIISDRLNDISEARFYLAAISYALVAGASTAAQEATAEHDAASAAAWSAAGAKMAELASLSDSRHYTDRMRCSGCIIGGFSRFNYDSFGYFRWGSAALNKAGEARNAYFELAS